jgi:hypothetical protein
VITVLADRNIALGALRLGRRQSGALIREPEGLLRLFHRLRLGAWRCRRDRVRLLHKVLPNLRRERAADDALDRTVIVIADTDASEKIVVKPDKPGIPIVLARSGLASRKTL